MITKRSLLPGRWAFAALLVGGLPLVFALGSMTGVVWVLLADAALLLVGVIDARAASQRRLVIERKTEGKLIVGVPNTIVIKVQNLDARRARLVLRDDVPQGWQLEPEELTIDLPPRGRRELRYTVAPSSRGTFQFGDLYVRVEGAGLGASLLQFAAGSEVRVYPNVRGPGRHALGSRQQDLWSAGVRQVRRTGTGGEFEQLREYARGDAYRDVDWKSTAKRRRPVTKVWTSEHSQSVILGIDAGRMMAPVLDHLTKLDHAINAALLLAHVALRSGDKVGLIVFSDRVHTFVPPARGRGQYRRLLDALFDVHAEVTFVDFRRLVEFAQLRVPRRSLFVLFSDLLDEAHAMPLAEHSAMLNRKHLPVCVTMSDPVATALADQPVLRDSDVYLRVAAADALAERETVKAHLRKAGVALVEAPAGELAVATVNRYLEIKARSML